jgi:hypothetical protein
VIDKQVEDALKGKQGYGKGMSAKRKKAREMYQENFCKFDYNWQKMPQEQEKEVHEE